MIQENTSILNFWLGKPFAKQNKINEQRKISNIVSEKDFGNTELAREDVDIPKLIDINYEELDKWNVVVTEKISAGSELTLKYIMYDPAKPPKVNGRTYLRRP